MIGSVRIVGIRRSSCLADRFAAWAVTLLVVTAASPASAQDAMQSDRQAAATGDRESAVLSTSPVAASPATAETYTSLNPLIERYMLDELKQLRQDQERTRALIAERLAQARLDATDRAVEYTTSTLNNVFFIITAAASILVLVGWNSLRDVKSRIDELVTRRINAISSEYEERLTTLEARLKRRSEELIAAQEEITKTNTMHALWMRCGLESTPHSKIEVLDQILAINPDDTEALCYKADAVLAVGEPHWALRLCDRVLAIDSDYPNGRWQRACALATLGFSDDAVGEISEAVNLSPTLRDELLGERAFVVLHGTEGFEALLPEDARAHRAAVSEAVNAAVNEAADPALSARTA